MDATAAVGRALGWFPRPPKPGTLYEWMALICFSGMALRLLVVPLVPVLATYLP